ncbi:MAG: hypothetical protein NC924_08135, partial [Candidatus Omnitrophica bacterium]|nr:hypothetical protein [Candidatus Omnitrophota bacterium]
GGGQNMDIDGTTNEAAVGTDLTLRDYLWMLFRQGSVIVACVATVVAVVFCLQELQTPLYEASVKMLISGEKQIGSQFYRDLPGNRNSQLALNQAEMVLARPVMERVVEALRLGERPLDYEQQYASAFKIFFMALKERMFPTTLAGYPPERQQEIRHQMAVRELISRTEVQPIRDTDLFRIKVKDYSPQEAALIANVVSRAYVVFDLEQQLAELQLKYGEKHLKVQYFQNNIQEMLKTLDGKTLPTISAIGPASVKIIEQASPPLVPLGMPRGKMLLMGFVLSVFLGVILAFMFEHFDQTLKTPRDVESLQVPFLGAVPRCAIGAGGTASGAGRDAFAAAADRVATEMKKRNYRALAVISAVPREGTTTIALNLAQVMAERGQDEKILLIDAHLRAPSLHTLLKKNAGPGLCGVLDGAVEAAAAVQAVTPRLDLLSAGITGKNAVRCLDPQRLREILSRFKERYAAIFIDCPDWHSCSDAETRVAAADAVVLAAQEGRVRRQVFLHILAAVRERVPVAGLILNRRTYPIPKMIYDRL